MPQPAPPSFSPPKADPEKPAEATTGQPAPPPKSANAQNNPFIIAIDGLEAIFKYAKSAAIFLVVVSVIVGLSSFVSDAFTPTQQHYEPTPADDKMLEEMIGSNPDINQIITLVILIAIVVLFAFVLCLVIGALLMGIGDVVSAATSKQKTVTLKEAFAKLMKRFPSYLWLMTLVWVKTLLWSLLFVIPGIVMAVRYSLAGTAFFARDMKASDAIRYSTTITKGGWRTLFASQMLFNIVTLGFLQLAATSGANAVLYKQYDALEQTHTAKQTPHWLSTLVTVVFFLLLALGFLLIGGAVLYLIFGYSGSIEQFMQS